MPVAVDRPPVAWDPIPFPESRVAEMRRYSVRHYGLHRARLIDPKVVVIHWTANTSYRATWNTFASDAPDPELRERPGTCAHFVIDQRGKVHQLVPLKWMCRHTVGLNWTAIGIEHVGTSDGALLGNRRQMDASIRLVRWLRGRYRIKLEDVIGHAESLSSPYHRERVARLRTQTHGDMQPRSMRIYRARLREA